MKAQSDAQRAHTNKRKTIARRLAHAGMHERASETKAALAARNAYRAAIGLPLIPAK